MIQETVTTVSTLEDAEKLISELENLNLFACAQTQEIRSTYLWNGEWITEDEIEIRFKHTPETKKDLIDKIRSVHPYEIPQIISFPVEATLEYEKWVKDSTKSTP